MKHILHQHMGIGDWGLVIGDCEGFHTFLSILFATWREFCKFDD